ncbi:MAG: hypothetical protein VYA86_05155, partial [Candidatus Thermoplasmatota archaeon]|nr:hypothetical protein [Candidatus Thermoplasmatota archaeon]
RDMLERIVGRCFHVIEEMNDVEIGWQVDVKNEGEDPAFCLEKLNNHLNRLSWIALLQEGTPFDLVIMPKLPQATGLSNGQMSAVWLVFTSFLTLAGAAWLQHQDPSPKLTDPDLLIHSLSWFSLPIILVMGVGSELRRRLALKSGVDLGHHIPLAVPFLMTPTVPIWPFGIVGFTSQRRMELICFKDRKSLAMVSIIAPLLMVLSGFFLTIIGYLLTGNSSPNFESAPITVSPSLIPELVLSLYIPAEEITLRSAWLHPLGLAGIALNAMGWLLLLPLPGFPGDRLLSALLNPGEMEEGGTQTWLFVGSLVAGMYIVLNGGYWPWLMLIAVGVWRRFSPEASATPLILNESKGFSERSKNSFSIILVSILLLGFPGMMPVQELDEWDAGLDTSSWPSDFSLSQGENSTITFPLNTIGVMVLDVELEFRINGPLDFVILSEISPECSGNLELFSEVECNFNGVDSISQKTLHFTLDSLNAIHNSNIYSDQFSIDIIWQEKLGLRTHRVNFTYLTEPLPTEFFWNWDGDSETPTYCVNMTHHSEIPGNMTVESNPPGLFSFDGNSQIALPAGEVSNVCIDGLYGTHDLMQSRTVETYLKTALDDGSIHQSKILFDTYLEIPGGYWPASILSASFLEGGQSMDFEYMMWFENPPDSTICPLSRVEMSIPTDENGTWEINMLDITEIALPDEQINGTILLPDHGYVVLCSNHQTAVLATLVPAEGILHSWTNVGNKTLNFSVETANFGINYDWGISGFSVNPGESIPPLNYADSDVSHIVQIVWVEPSTDEWVLHLVSHCTSNQGCSEGDV